MRAYSTYRLIFGLFEKLEKFMVHQWSLLNYFASKTQKISLHYYFSQRHAIKNSSGQMRQISGRMEMIHPRIMVEDRMSTGLTKTHTVCGFSDLYHVYARKHCILCSALRHGCLALLYVTSIRDFSAPGTIAHGSIRLPSRSLASSRGCSLAIITGV